MLLKRAALEEIVAGRVRFVFRRWKRATVKAGGSLKTAVGVLSIRAVDTIRIGDLTERDAKLAGFESLTALRKDVRGQREGTLYRIDVAFGGADPRIALRGRRPTKAELAQVVGKLGRMDARSSRGPWTRTFLHLIERQPGVRAGDLAETIGLDKPAFKRDVRKLKALGLTESLEVGYRLSPRGKHVLKSLA